MTVHDQPLMIALVAGQFGVHALGWTMAAQLFRGWRAAEGHFALSWALFAAGLLCWVPELPSGHPWRNTGNVLVVLAGLAAWRGFALHEGAKPRDGVAAAVLAAVVLAQFVSLGLTSGHALRIATVAWSCALLVVAMGALGWQRRAALGPALGGALLVACALLAPALLWHGLRAFAGGDGSKVSLDAPQRGHFVLVVLVLLAGGVFNLVQIRIVLGRVWQRLRAQALADPLTGAANRRGLIAQLEEMHSRAQRGARSYVMLMVDIDHFKAVNDAHGHAAGDLVLRRVARGLREALRVGDVVGRWGGEEFCVLLPRIGLADAVALAERVAAEVAAAGADGEPRVTVSIGVAEADAERESSEELLRRADRALYAAKAAGRNRVVSAPARG